MGSLDVRLEPIFDVEQLLEQERVDDAAQAWATEPHGLSRASAARDRGRMARAGRAREEEAAGHSSVQPNLLRSYPG